MSDNDFNKTVHRQFPNKIFEIRSSPVAIADFAIPVRISFDKFCELTKFAAPKVHEMLRSSKLNSECYDGKRFITLDDKADLYLRRNAI